MMTPPIIEANGLSRRFRVPQRPEGDLAGLRHFFRRQYKDVVAVDDVSFRLDPSERVGFLGANGAGKTTTLKMLSGLLLPSAGDVVVAGHRPFDKTSAFLRTISLVMGNKQQLMWDLPARESLKLQASIFGLDDAVWRPRVDELASLLSLSTLLDQPVRKLSLGERMKAELLCALLHRPQVLFLDEPTLGLDVNAQAAVREFLKRYNEQTGATILLTSHYMADITALCSRVLVIHAGRLLFDGDLKALTARFAPEKRIELELSDVVDDAVVQRVLQAVRADARCEAFRHLECEGRLVCFAIPPSSLAPALQRLLAVVSPSDLSVTDTPIEDVVGRVISGQLSSSSS
jgi:ABC-2 type transport system ATP-binding protein